MLHLKTQTLEHAAGSVSLFRLRRWQVDLERHAETQPHLPLALSSVSVVYCAFLCGGFQSVSDLRFNWLAGVKNVKGLKVCQEDAVDLWIDYSHVWKLQNILHVAAGRCMCQLQSLRSDQLMFPLKSRNQMNSASASSRKPPLAVWIKPTQLTRRHAPGPGYSPSWSGLSVH